MVVYRIRNKNTGLYYSRKRPYKSPSEMVFTKNGKTWSRLSDAVLTRANWPKLLGDCEIVEFEIKEVGVVR